MRTELEWFDIVLGRFLFALSMSLLFLIGIIDWFGNRFDNQWISRTAALLDESFWADLSIYGGCVTIIAVSLSVFVPESGNEPFIDLFTTVDPFLYVEVWMVMVFWAFTLALHRYKPPMHEAYAT